MMDRIIELLNAYGEHDLVIHDGKICKLYTSSDGELNIYQDFTLEIISRRYGFVEWLMEHSNIELENRWILDEEEKRYSDYDTAIMLISISDDPIQSLFDLFLNER